MKEQLRQTIEFLKSRGFESPEIGIVLGTGLGQLLRYKHPTRSQL